MILPLLAWSVAAVLAAVAVGRRIRGREDDAAVAAERTDPPALAGFARRAAKPLTADVAAFDRLFGALDRREPRLAKVALLRWLGGLSPARAAAVLHVAPAEVERDLATARTVGRRGSSGPRLNPS